MFSILVIPYCFSVTVQRATRIERLAMADPDQQVWSWRRRPGIARRPSLSGGTSSRRTEFTIVWLEAAVC